MPTEENTNYLRAQKLAALLAAPRPAMLAALGLPEDDPTTFEELWSGFGQLAAHEDQGIGLIDSGHEPYPDKPGLYVISEKAGFYISPKNVQGDYTKLRADDPGKSGDAYLKLIPGDIASDVNEITLDFTNIRQADSGSAAIGVSPAVDALENLLSGGGEAVTDGTEVPALYVYVDEETLFVYPFGSVTAGGVTLDRAWGKVNDSGSLESLSEGDLPTLGAFRLGSLTPEQAAENADFFTAIFSDDPAEAYLPVGVAGLSEEGVWTSHFSALSLMHMTYFEQMFNRVEALETALNALLDAGNAMDGAEAGGE
jgi:hypothetical protein